VSCFAALVLAACASCGGCDDETEGGVGVGGAGGTGGAPPVVPWDEPDLEYRVTVTLVAHPDRDRIDLPVIAPLDHPGSLIASTVRIHELGGGTDTSPMTGSAWSQPNGEVFEVGFTAQGTTAAGETRTFLVYYDLSSEPPEWGWSADGWASFAMQDGDDDGTDDGFRLTGGDYAVEREIDQASGTLRPSRRAGEATALSHVASDWMVANGFSDSYQLESATTTHAPTGTHDQPFVALASSGNDAWAAASASWSLDSPVVHDALLTYRVFATWPFAEMVLSVDTEAAAEPHRLSGADYSARRLYLADSFDRMVSDTRDDEALASVWDTSMRWLVVYDAASNRGFGWFIAHRGVIRAASDDGISIFDSYAGSAGTEQAYRYLWMAGADKDVIAQLFDEMVPGVDVSAPENRDLNIVVPVAGSFYFPEDELSVTVTTPGSTAPVTATVRDAEGGQVAVTLANDADPLRWTATSPLGFDQGSPVGTWTVAAEAGEATAEVSFEFRLPDHPKLVFSGAELAEIQARKDDPAYDEIWQAMLSAAGSYDAPIPDPGPGRDIRGYAERLLNLGLIQLCDPTQPYADRMWEYFFAMLRYPNWAEGADPPFNNEDLTVGHFLTALSLIYDWHYEALTPTERAEVRDHLRTVTSRWLHTSYLRHHRDIEYTRYGAVTGNHYWINHEGVAAATFVLADEMPEPERSGWVDHLEENLATILSVLEDDGTSHEGVAYHSYGQINLFPWLDMRDRALGGNTAEQIPWFAESALWDVYSVLPGGDDNYGGVANFGDCPPRHYNPPRTINAWLARRLGSGPAQWSAEQIQYPRFSAWSYLWYDPSVAAVSPTGLPTFRLFPDKGIFAWRSSWDDDATYVSLKSGSYFGGHEQPDAGHFIVHRGGVPYVTDHGYSYRKETDEHNLILVDGTGQHGSGSQWMSPVDPAGWAQVDSALGDDAYFDVVADPTAMYESTTLTSWKREILGLGPDIFVVHDAVAGSASMDVTWLLHSYRSDPPTSPTSTYTYKDRRLENPWAGPSGGPWTVTPQDGAAVLHVADVSFGAWSSTVEPSMYVPEQDPDAGGYNSGLNSFQVGNRLARQAQGAQLRSTVALWFGDTLAATSWSTAAVEAVRLYEGSSEIAHLLWPSSGSASGFHGFDVVGAMAGRRYDALATFGRGVTQIVLSGTGALLAASAPVDLFARLEHASPTAQDPHRVVVTAAQSTQVTLRCPQQPAQLTDESGSTVPFSWTSGQLTFDAAGGSRRYTATY
jgi:hypothetical protein